MTRTRRAKPLASALPRAWALEPRLMFDAAAVTTAATAVSKQLDPALADATADHYTTPDPAHVSRADTPVALPASVGATPHELVIVDGNIDGLQSLLANLRSDVEVVVLGVGSESWDAVTRAIESGHDWTAVHLISHGDTGSILLGGTRYTAADLQSRADEFGQWKSYLATGADILIYGCDVGAGAEGAALVATLSQLTGADVAASSNETGAARLGGDWTLETRIGDVTAASPLERADAFDSLLALTEYNVNGLSMSFQSPTSVSGSGTGMTAGDVMRFGSVVTVSGQTLDALVTTVSLPAGSMTAYDNSSGNPSSLTEPWQPNFNFSAAGIATFQVRFVKTGTSTQVALTNVLVNSYDIDGIGSGSQRQLQQFQNFSYFEVGSGSGSTQIQSQTTDGSVQFQSTVATNNTVLAADNYRVRVFYDRIETFQLATGTVGAGGTAYFSLEFGPGPSWTNTPITKTMPTLAYSTTNFAESVANDGSIATTATITLAPGTFLPSTTFAGTNGVALPGVTVSNVPAGLTASVVRVDATHVTLSFTGNATAHANANDFSDVQVAFGDTSFAGGTHAGAVAGSTHGGIAIDFADPVIVPESAGYAQFSVGGNSGTTMTLSLSAGTATGGGTDYGSGGTNNLQYFDSASSTWKDYTTPVAMTSEVLLVRTPIVNDTLYEASETFKLTATPSVGSAATGTATITDDDAVPTVSSVASASATEGSGVAHTVTLTNGSYQSTTFSLSLTDGTATGGGTDYTSALTNAAFSNGVTISGGTITVPAGVTSFTVTVPTTSDTIDEPNETYTLTIGTKSGTGTINDDDAAPTVGSVSSNSATEASSVVHTVTLTNGSYQSTTFSLSLTDGTATGGGTDYTSALTNAAFSNGVTISGGTITVPAGVTSFTVSVPTTSDTIDEPNETYTLTVGSAAGTGTINDDDAAPTIGSVSSNSATEASDIVHTVTLSNASYQDTTFSASLTDGTATGGGTDYTSTLTNASFNNGVTISGGTITVPAGVTSFTVTVPTTSDTIDEANETYTLTVGTKTGTGTINDDDPAPTIGSVSSNSATEASDIVHTVTLSNASYQDTTFSASLTDGTATGGGVDYTSTLTNASFSNGVTISGGTITVPAGVTSFTVTVPTTSDTIDEANETYTLTVGTKSGTGTINDDDNAPTIGGVSSNSATEASDIVHTVTLSNASYQDTTFSASLTDGTATGGGVDYTSTLTNASFSNGVTISGGTITVPAGVTSFTVTVPTTSDTIDEANETYTLTVGTKTGTGTINDDDPAPTIGSVSSNSATEASDIVHTVTLSNASATDTTFSASLTDGTATGGGVDYTSTLTNASFSNGVTISGGTITVPAGVTSFTVTVPTTSDTIDEANETYTLTVGTKSGTGTINDDDNAPTISGVSSNSATEASDIVHTVTLSNASYQDTTFSASLTDGTATGGGVDYTSTLTNASFS
ncbi:MAG TPA: DUF4347 domain-containing protein, partial [Ramlibacter sp.]|uniref:DUF4347 domain-containing protein n=1 Tax=Ramlibacter sp. TaxID=1917967 RepID=UPI002D1DC2BF